MPETLKGLWKQRLRWAQGGAEVFLKNISKVVAQRKLSNVATVFEYLIFGPCLPGRFHYLRSPTCRCTVK